MRKKAITKTQTNPWQYPSKIKKSTSLSQLSISQIYQQKPNFDSVDFQQQRELICQFLPRIQEAEQEYGLKVVSKKSKLKKVKSKPTNLFQKESESLPYHDHQETRQGSSRKQLCFDRDIRRKKSPSSNNFPPQRSQNFMRKNKKDLYEENEKTIKKSKESIHNPPSLFFAAKIIPSIHSMLKFEKIKTSLTQSPLKLSERIKNQQRCAKIYYLREDDIKKQISDINLNLLMPAQSLNEGQHFRDKTNSLIRSVKVSPAQSSEFIFQHEKKRPSIVETCYYRQEPVNRKDKLLEFKRPTSVDLKMKSVTTPKFMGRQSNYSGDSSTSTHRTSKKDQIPMFHQDYNQFCIGQNSQLTNF